MNSRCSVPSGPRLVLDANQVACCTSSSARRAIERAGRRAGLTLIEMLVAVTITLMVILAIVQVFDLLGTNIKNGQALIEVTTDLRFISQQLQQDIDGVTCPVRTWLDPAEGEGYFEVYDGPSRDRNWNYNWTTANPSLPIIDMAQNMDADPTNDEDASMGDIDDYLSLTTRNIETPFLGRIPINVNNVERIDNVESKDAEVTWWTAAVTTNFLDANGDGVIDVGDALDPVTPGRLSPTSSVSLFRHVGLILPGIDLSPTEETTLGRPALTLQAVQDFLDNYDVSVRWVDTNADGRRNMLFANSLADLTQRENRFLRYVFVHPTNGLVPLDPTRTDIPPAELSGAVGQGGFPFPFANLVLPSSIDISGWPVDNEIKAYELSLPAAEQSTLRRNLAMPRRRFARFPYSISIFALSGETVDSYRFYSALMARSLVSDNIRAFDIRCFDPNAPVYTPAGQTNIVLAPGDPAYPINDNDKTSRLVPEILPSTPPGKIAFRGLGAYVDLQYADNPSIPNDGPMVSSVDVNGDNVADYQSWSKFSKVAPTNIATNGWWPFYDTWSIHYERDGIDQFTSGAIAPGTIDEGTNEVDDDGQNGVDDVGERETAAYVTFDTPLRGIEVTIRKMDYETRQIRQTSIVGDFIPE